MPIGHYDHTVVRGANNYNWKGGKHFSPAGHTKVLMPNHPRADSKGYVREHIVVVERAIGKPLNAGAIIHHLNGDARDNKPQNLVVCENQAYHLLLHARQRAFIACGNANFKRCKRCKEYSDPVTMRCDGSAYFHRSHRKR
jgi:HNH endonuclease